jgi:hypothetical protein
VGIQPRLFIQSIADKIAPVAVLHSLFTESTVARRHRQTLRWISAPPTPAWQAFISFYFPFAMP